jgi:hypothetical protein
MADVTYFPPKKGFSKGTKQGLQVCSVLLIGLIAIPLTTEISGFLSVSLDLAAALFAAVAVVWVVGGLFEFQGKIRDLQVKAAGGAAIFFFVMWNGPYSTLQPDPTPDVIYSLQVSDTLGDVIDFVQGESAGSRTGVVFDLRGNQDSLRRLRPIKGTGVIEFRGKDWFEVFRKISEIAPCLFVERLGNRIGLSISGRTEEVEFGPSRKKIVFCQ